MKQVCELKIMYRVIMHYVSSRNSVLLLHTTLSIERRALRTVELKKDECLINNKLLTWIINIRLNNEKSSRAVYSSTSFTVSSCFVILRGKM